MYNVQVFESDYLPDKSDLPPLGESLTILRFILTKPKVNIFKIKNEYKNYFKHWAIILELSNNTFVCIQFGRNGFSLKEFNETDVKGGNIINAIQNIWGEKEHPVSFCYLGNANYEYDKLKSILESKKEEEKKVSTKME